LELHYGCSDEVDKLFKGPAIRSKASYVGTGLAFYEAINVNTKASAGAR
jgi:hypothetical protein